MAYEAPVSARDSYASGLKTLFQFMSERIQQPCPEPAGLGPNVDAGLSAGHRMQFSQRLAGAARRATYALELESRKDMPAANAVWGEILGPDYRWK
jgi:hypothetical protein